MAGHAQGDALVSLFGLLLFGGIDIEQERGIAGRKAVFYGRTKTGGKYGASKRHMRGAGVNHRV
ncbi:hypothetical protein BM590_A0098 [Brucella melitensis M5-90]|nr:hypothetical protein BM28_A0105 [Brucella melitensis M28]ADZ86043.1 hypothetical protein BM590_A0098 [Brucella melitensis M5-90]AEW16567.1 putative membrane-associated Zn-dependent proteases 1 [Brucella abortus A13334]AIB16832.1 Hypothetical protein BSSP3_I0096 [Brucella suis bv. 2]